MASSDFLEILEYAKGNRVQLEKYLNCTSDSNEERSEMLRYREFFKDLEDSAELMLTFNVCNRDTIRKLGEILWKLKEEAEMKIEMTGNTDLCCMYFQFINDHKSLIEMVSVLDHPGNGKSTGAEEFGPEDSQTATADHAPNGHADFETGGAAGNAVRPDPNVQYQFGTTHSSYITNGQRGVSRDYACGTTTVPSTAALHHVETRGTGVPNANNDAHVHEECPFSISRQQGEDTDEAEDALLDLLDHSAPQHGISPQPHNQSSRNRVNAVPGIPQTCTVQDPLRHPAKTTSAPPQCEKPDHAERKLEDLLDHGGSQVQAIRAKKNQTESSAMEIYYESSHTTNASGSNPNERSEGAQSGNVVPDPPSTGTELKTFKQALDAFDLYPRLTQLEESLEKVRRRRKRPEEHDQLWKRLDKELLHLCREQHPDKVMNKMGSREEIERAKERQTALNAIRTVLQTLTKLFLEEIDVDHRYEFYALLDIGLLGNEDEVESHVYDVLFKISLVSDIKQERIVAEIKLFLAHAQRSLDRFLEGEQWSFEQYFDWAFDSLKRCVSGYEKLHEELVEVEKECRGERVNNIRPVIQNMKRDVSRHLKHLKALLELSEQSSTKLPSMYRPASETVDEYFVLPLVNYVNVLLACDVMRRTETDEGTGMWGLLRFSNWRQHGSTPMDPQPISDGLYSPPPLLELQPISDGGDEISLLHQLASCYSGNKQYKKMVKQFYNWNHMDPINVKRKFMSALRAVRDKLAAMFSPEDYVEGGTRKRILKELEVCREMMSEFKQRAAEVRTRFQEISANNERVKRGIDQLLIDHSAIRNDMSVFKSKAKMHREMGTSV